MRKAIKISVLIATLAPAATFAQTPGLPHQFYGTVSYDSGTAGAGLTVRALIGNTVVGTSVTQDGSKYGIMPDLLIVANQAEGSAVLFTVNGAPARETATFENGALTSLNLTVPGAAPSASSAPATSNTASASGGGGGSGGVSAPAATPAVQSSTTPALTESQKVFDANTDNKIDVLDFNLLIVHWGETGSNAVADFDKNGVVDVFDFNSLMVHWTA